MVHLTERIEPRLATVAADEERYQQFRVACQERGYL
jgi:hypothetical protein